MWNFVGPSCVVGLICGGGECFGVIDFGRGLCAVSWTRVRACVLWTVNSTCSAVACCSGIRVSCFVRPTDTAVASAVAYACGTFGNKILKGGQVASCALCVVEVAVDSQPAFRMV